MLKDLLAGLAGLLSAALLAAATWSLMYQWAESLPDPPATYSVASVGPVAGATIPWQRSSSRAAANRHNEN